MSSIILNALVQPSAVGSNGVLAHIWPYLCEGVDNALLELVQITDVDGVNLALYEAP